MSRRNIAVSVAGTGGSTLKTGDVITGAAQRDVVIQNGLVKLTFETTTEPGAHTLYRWDGSDYARLMGPEYGDWTYFASEFTSGPDRTRIEYADADRVKVVLEWDAHAANAAQWPADYVGGPTGFYQRNHLGALNYDSNAHPIRVGSVKLYKVVEVRRGREGYFRAMRSDPHLGPYSGLSGNNDTSLGERESGSGGGNAVSFASSGFIARHPAWGSDANWGGAGNYPANRHAWARIDDPDYSYTALADYITYQNNNANAESPTYPNEQTTGPWWVADIPHSGDVAAGFVRYIALVERMEAGFWQFSSTAYGFTSIHHTNDIRATDGRWHEFQLFVGAFPYEPDTSDDYANEPSAGLRQKVINRCPLDFEASGQAEDDGPVGTTAQSIRSSMIGALKVKTPGKLAHLKFRPYPEDGGPFRAFADRKPTSAFRMFSIRDVGQGAAPGFSDSRYKHVEREWECVVAYPLGSLGDMGARAGLSLEDLLEEDALLVEQTIGTNGFQTLEQPGACVISEEPRYVAGEACMFLVLPLRVTYWRTL